MVEVVADKGYHAAETLELNEHLGLRTYIPEPQRKHERRWTDKPPEFQQAVYTNRRRMRRAKGESSNAAAVRSANGLCPHLRHGGRAANLAARTGERDQMLLDRRRRADLGRILRKLFGIGKPKNLQGGSGLAAIMQLAMIAAQITLTTLENLRPSSTRREIVLAA